MHQVVGGPIRAASPFEVFGGGRDNWVIELTEQGVRLAALLVDRGAPDKDAWFDATPPGWTGNYASVNVEGGYVYVTLNRDSAARRDLRASLASVRARQPEWQRSAWVDLA